jgi:hypothetical protein
MKYVYVILLLLVITSCAKQRLKRVCNTTNPTTELLWLANTLIRANINSKYKEPVFKIVLRERGIKNSLKRIEGISIFDNYYNCEGELLVRVINGQQASYASNNNYVLIREE